VVPAVHAVAGATPPTVDRRWMKVTPPKTPGPRVVFAVTSSCGMLFGVVDGAETGAVPSTSEPSSGDSQLGPRKCSAEATLTGFRLMPASDAAGSIRVHLVSVQP
jgi:hypothetical protein